jgi:hypothetical protein
LRCSPRSSKETKFLRPNSRSARKWRDQPTSARDETGKIPALIAVTSAIDFRVGNIASIHDRDSDATAEMTPEPTGPSNVIHHCHQGVYIPPLDITIDGASRRGLNMEEEDYPQIRKEEESMH